MKNNTKLHSAVLSLAAVILVLILVSVTASASTLSVGSTAKYKTIQSAVNAAHSGDTVKVASGTYKEDVIIPFGVYSLKIIGSKYPKVYGFSMDYSGASINGFSINKYGIDTYANGEGIILRNNYFYNCGIAIAGDTSSGTSIINNKFSHGGIAIYDTFDQTITGNTINSAKMGLDMQEDSGIASTTKNTFENCQIGVQLFSVPPGLIGNTYKNNKVNIKMVP
jgi:nitrous oxidase accessory protein NosD